MLDSLTQSCCKRFAVTIWSAAPTNELYHVLTVSTPATHSRHVSACSKRIMKASYKNECCPRHCVNTPCRVLGLDPLASFCILNMPEPGNLLNLLLRNVGFLLGFHLLGWNLGPWSHFRAVNDFNGSWFFLHCLIKQCWGEIAV